MNKLICPFCQQELEDANIHSSGLYFECPNCYDKQKEKDDNYTATPRIWQELIRTRKALDVAVDEITKIKVASESVGIGFFMTAAISALAKIKTALEQKDYDEVDKKPYK